MTSQQRAKQIAIRLYPAITPGERGSLVLSISSAIDAAVAAEREACAKVAERMISQDTDWDTSYWNQCAERIAAAIRARQ